MHGVIEEDIACFDRTTVIVEVALEFESYFGSFGDVDIEVGSDVVFFEVDVGVEIVHPLVAHQSVILIEGCREIIARHLTAAADVEVHALVHGCGFEHFLDPVYCRIDIRIAVRIHRRGDFGFGIRQDAEGIACRDGFVVESHIGNGIGDINHPSRHRPCVLNTYGDSLSS